MPNENNWKNEFIALDQKGFHNFRTKHAENQKI